MGKTLGTWSSAEGMQVVLVTTDGDFTKVSGLEVEEGRDNGAGSQTQRLSTMPTGSDYRLRDLRCWGSRYSDQEARSGSATVTTVICKAPTTSQAPS